MEEIVIHPVFTIVRKDLDVRIARSVFAQNVHRMVRRAVILRDDLAHRIGLPYQRVHLFTQVATAIIGT